jgi:hypothetical protein
LTGAGLAGYDPTMSELVIRRKRVWWMDRLRDYRMLVDGEEVARVANGAEARIPVEPGPHIVQMRIDWCGSLPLAVDVAPGETRVLSCGPRANPLTVLLYIGPRRGSYLWLRAEP